MTSRTLHGNNNSHTIFKNTDQESNAGISAEVMIIALTYFVTVSMLIKTAM